MTALKGNNFILKPLRYFLWKWWLINRIALMAWNIVIWR